MSGQPEPERTAAPRASERPAGPQSPQANRRPTACCVQYVSENWPSHPNLSARSRRSWTHKAICWLLWVEQSFSDAYPRADDSSMTLKDIAVRRLHDTGDRQDSDATVAQIGLHRLQGHQGISHVREGQQAVAAKLGCCTVLRDGYCTVGRFARSAVQCRTSVCDGFPEVTYHGPSLQCGMQRPWSSP